MKSGEFTIIYFHLTLPRIYEERLSNFTFYGNAWYIQPNPNPYSNVNMYRCTPNFHLQLSLVLIFMKMGPEC